MALVAMRQLLDHAAEHGYAIPAFNIHNLEIVQAVMGAAACTAAPVILQSSGVARDYAGPAFVRHLVAGAVETWPHIPIALHDDHCRSLEACRRAIDNGCTSVMMDGTLHEDGRTVADLEYNVRVSAQAVAHAHALGVTVENELGALGSLETMRYEVEAPGAARTRDELLTDPDQAAEFVRRTGCDALAVAVGAIHGPNKFSRPPTAEVLVMDRLREIHARVPSTHLVLHGASTLPMALLDGIRAHGGVLEDAWGVPVGELQRAIGHGVRKINIDTDIRLAMTGALRETLWMRPGCFDPRDYVATMRDAAQALIAERFVAFGCEGQGARIKPVPLEAFAARYRAGA
ncbi:MAG: ketose-bisphosphate aldolase [Gammaproteobacteria bacterium]